MFSKAKTNCLLGLGCVVLAALVFMPLFMYSGYLNSETISNHPDYLFQLSELNKQLETHNEILQLIQNLETPSEYTTAKKLSDSYTSKFQSIESKLESLTSKMTNLEVKVDKIRLDANTGNKIMENTATTSKKSSTPPIYSKTTPFGLDTVLLIICYNRADYLSQTLNYILQYHPKTGVPLVISQDGDNSKVSVVIEQFKSKFSLQFPQVPFIHLSHTQQQLSGDTGYHKLARHYKWAFSQCFYSLSSFGVDVTVNRVLVIEDDLQISPDFFQYFQALAPFLDDVNENLLAVSAWNDNGQQSHVVDPKSFYRSDFFPGLGWMLHRRIWVELEPIWPQAYWDDWLREDRIRKGRHVLRPEICRTFHFGVAGTSNSQYSDFLTKIKLNNDIVDYSSIDLKYLMLDNWDAEFTSHVNSLPMLSWQEATTTSISEVRVPYTSEADFERISRNFFIMDNIKAHVPRTAYKGIVSFWYEVKGGGKVKIHLYLSL